MSTIHTPSRRLLRLALAGLGGVALLIGGLTVVSPRAAAVTRRTTVALLGTDYVLVAILGAIALVIVAAVVVSRSRSGLDQASPPAPEGVHPVPHFGAEFDAFLTESRVQGLTGAEQHDEARSQLRDVAIATVMRDANCTRAEARERIDAGTWTDKELAATFLTETQTPGLRARLRAALTGTAPTTQAARVTAAEIARRDAEAER